MDKDTDIIPASFEVSLVTFIHQMSCYGWNLTRFRMKPSEKTYFLDFASRTGKDSIQHGFNAKHEDGLEYLYKVMRDAVEPRD